MAVEKELYPGAILASKRKIETKICPIKIRVARSEP